MLSVRATIYPRQMEHPKAIGDRTTLAVMLALQATGYAISVPFGENTRYDLLADDGDCVLRIQCKTGRLQNGAVFFRPSSSYAHHKSPRLTRRCYVGEIDFFGVHCRETGGVYLVPISDVRTTWMAALRVEPARNSQKQHVRQAAQYEIARVELRQAESCRRSGPAHDVRQGLRVSAGARRSSA